MRLLACFLARTGLWDYAAPSCPGLIAPWYYITKAKEGPMARKNRYQYDQNQDFDTTERVSRSQKKRESTALQELGASLAKLPLRELERLGISPDLLAAYRELSRITSREAKRRQMQYIGRLMREEDDTERLQEAVALFEEGRRPSDVL
ncbi:hypothetical protein B5F76_00660 [Desulfovibrio sp. An276]|nr:hypothetical protein B5F76_00660 [Desulfovibrio sp. An276]